MLTDPVRFSNLKAMARSAAHYKHAVEVGREDARHFRIGRALHCLILGGKQLVVFPGASRRGKEWEKFEDAHVDDEIVIASEFAIAEAMEREVRKNPDAMRLLEGAREQRIEWEFIGRRCAGTPDVRSDAVVELKSTRCSEPQRFTRDATWLGYHAQLSWYRDGVVASGLGQPSEAFIVAVESAPPFPVTVMRLTQRALDQGARLCRLWMERLLACEAAGEWPPYCQGVVDFDVPDDDVTLIFPGDSDDEEAA